MEPPRCRKYQKDQLPNKLAIIPISPTRLGRRTCDGRNGLEVGWWTVLQDERDWAGGTSPRNLEWLSGSDGSKGENGEVECLSCGSES